MTGGEYNRVSPKIHDGMEKYLRLYEESVSNSEAFWDEQAQSLLTWDREYDSVASGGFEHGDVAWFTNGKLNVCYNCLDRHLEQRGDQVAILWERDEPGEEEKITYKELHREVCRIANAMKSQGVQKGDYVTIYMPMMPEAVMVMLACARLGAPHSVVFAGFSAEALRTRIRDCGSKWVFTADEGKRGGKTISLKATTDAAVSACECVNKVFVFKRTGAQVPMDVKRDVYMDELLPKMRPYCPHEPMDAEDVLFVLYTSGSTGAPKGVAHTQAGYALYTALTTKVVFDLNEGDVYACMADVGWITGHSYIVYGPLLNGATTVLFESTPLYPDASRYWDLVERHHVTQFYTAPTAIRSLMKFGDSYVKKCDLSSLKILGSVGEPINPEAWRWYYEVVGDRRCTIVDTWWQTETGGHMATALPSLTDMKPGSCSFPFFGIELAVLDKDGSELTGNGVEGVLAIKKPWPSIARTILNDHERYLNIYMRPYKGYFFTGDGCRRDEDGFYWITGRVDDVINMSGHRIGTAEIESALVAQTSVAEAAVVGYPHDVKGEGVCCYVILKQGFQPSQDLEKSLKNAVRQVIGPFATPDMVVPVSGLPKTRSGKIMRRILRKVAALQEDQLGDVSTLAEPGIVEELITQIRLRK